MKYVNSIYTPDQTGRLGGVVFGKNKYGYYQKMFKSPTNPRTADQQTIRSFFSTATKEWANLTSAQRTAWNDNAGMFQYVKKGISYTVTGFNLFVKLNRNLQSVGASFYEDIDRTTLITPPGMNGSTFDVITTPGTEDIKLDIPTVLDANTIGIVCATPVLKSSRIPDWKTLRIIGTIDHTFASGDSIKTMYLSRYGKLPKSGDIVGFTVMPVNSTCGLTNAKVYVTAVGTV